MSQELVYLAPTKGNKGYEKHSREVLRILYNKGMKIQHICLPFLSDKVELDPEMQDVISETMANKVSDTAPILILSIAQSVLDLIQRGGISNISCSNRKLYNYTTWETDKIPVLWSMLAKELSCTFVTNEFLRDVWTSCGVPHNKVEVIHEGVNTDMYHPDAEPLPLHYRGQLLQDRFQYRFFVSAEISARKNIKSVITSFIKAFKDTDYADKTCLILKVSYLHKDTNEQDYFNDIDSSGVHIVLCDQVFPDIYMPSLFANATHYVTASYGEGWDLNCVEMAAMGKVIIAPYHTAYKDYLNDDVAYLIKNCVKIPAVHNSPGINRLMQGSCWFRPDNDELVSLMRESVENSKLSEKKSHNCLKHIVKKFTWGETIDKLYKYLVEYQCGGCHIKG
ncbi:MAG: glycosyltransferase [Candidatus Dojkabacteria bacterium]